MAATKPAQAAQAAEAAQPDEVGPSTTAASSVVYIGHLPHGFYEDELLGFFSQFGRLTRVRVSRNKRTGKPKHYAFLEFGNHDVARIAADAMNGYFLFKQQLRCRVLQESELHPDMFKGANRRFKKVPWRKIERARHEKARTPEEHAARVARLVRRDAARAARIAAAGLDYEYPRLAQPAASKKIKFM